jgi:hypothetical protein
MKVTGIMFATVGNLHLERSSLTMTVILIDFGGYCNHAIKMTHLTKKLNRLFPLGHDQGIYFQTPRSPGFVSQEMMLDITSTTSVVGVGFQTFF